MIFQNIDKWMLDIEEKKDPTHREKLQHMKLERIRNKTYSRYLKVPLFRNQSKAPIHCKERAMPPMLRAISNVWDIYSEHLGLGGRNE